MTSQKKPAPRAGRQRGGFVIGFVIGLLIGLVIALAVALYVTKVPVPFVNKVPQRTAEQDAAEAERNKNWDPNAGLGGKTAPPKVAAPAASPVAPAPAPAVDPPPAPGAVPPPARPGASAPAAPPQSTRDPAAILGDKPLPPPTSAAQASDPFLYFVQAGAYARQEDAEQQRARLGLLGVQATLSEREQAGRTVYRVRLGPYERREDAEAAKDKLAGGGVEAALVRVQK
jgi:cell division protein FtsN